MQYDSNLYELQGNFYTLTELSRMSNLHRDTIHHRLELGLSVEEALELTNSKSLPVLSRDDLGKQVKVVFNKLPPVLPHMQPILGKQYTAKICGSSARSKLVHVFYMIQLENGKKLITYPGECTIVTDDSDFTSEKKGA